MNSISIIILLILLSAGSTLGQVQDSTSRVSVKGVVWDSTLTTLLRSATVAVYSDKDSILLAYTLTNNFGEFEFKNIPGNKSLRIVASFVGYTSITKKVVPYTSLEVDIGYLNLSRSDGLLDEVVVYAIPPPVRMNGDTLEFNSDAFKMDTNALTEDLLRRLPGVTVWSDGTITVNGREVSRVLVNGKPFYGTDARMATQNIPKNAVDKVQVYQRNKDQMDGIVDSITEINIKLKKGKDFGYFGKFNLGLGNRSHYDADLSFNRYNSKTQLGLALAHNNVNKIANGMQVLQLQNTFKGTGANVEYQSDFELPGVNKFTAGGITYQHDFIANPDYQNENRINADYFYKQHMQDIVRRSRIVTSMNNGKYFVQENQSMADIRQINQNANFRYNKRQKQSQFYLSSNIGFRSSNELQDENTKSISDQGLITSSNKFWSNTSNDEKRLSIIANYRSFESDKSRRGLSPYEIIYNLHLTDNLKNRDYRSQFIIPSNIQENQDVSRLYNTNVFRLVQHFELKIPDLATSLFQRISMPGWKAGFHGEVEIPITKDIQNVQDFNEVNDKYQFNTYLTNRRHEIIYNIKPALVIGKYISKSLSDRFEKIFTTDLNIGPEFYNLNNNSQKQFQEISRKFSKIRLNSSFFYNNHQVGDYQFNIRLQFKIYSEFPQVNQIAPLVDSANLYFVQEGNLKLKEQNNREVSLQFVRTNLRKKNTESFSINLRGLLADNYFATNTNIDTFGRTTFNIINANGYRYLNAGIEIKKDIRGKSNQLQFIFSPHANIIRSPIVINNRSTFMNRRFLSLNPVLSYSFKDYFDLKISIFNSWNSNVGDQLQDILLINRTARKEISFNLKCTPRLSLASNLIHTNNSFNEGSTIAFNLWNASIQYRMLPGNNAELKFSALDILGQNTGLANDFSSNSITQGQVNVLRQYFMLSFAWYPRQFGKRKD